MDKGQHPGPGGLPALSPFEDANRSSLTVLKKRRDFLAAAKARRWSAPGLNLQGRKRRDGEECAPDDVRVGFTCSKKVGNAVVRNRAKRRLRAAASDVLPRLGKPGWDYVLIGRADMTTGRQFTDLIGDLEKAVLKVHAPKPSSRK